MAISEVRDLDTAEELFRELSPATGSIWTKHIGHGPAAEWVFRGQSNGADGSIWPLMPSALRANVFLPFVQSAVGPLHQLNAAEQREEELLHVLRFASAVDRHGQIVPGDAPELRDRRTQPPPVLTRWDEFPPVRLVPMFALAQHYGIPTRLLDWTWKPLVAAYFAAAPVAQRRVPGVPVPPDAPFSVFALRGDVVPASRGLDSEIHLIPVPTATNPNLHAQGGLFSLVQPRATDEDPLPTLDAVLRRHEQQIARRPYFERNTYEWRFPLLIEFRVPSREARTTMMLLAHMGMSGAAIYPGLAGAAAALREERFYQWADHGSRS